MRKISNLHDLVTEKQRLQQKLDLLKRELNMEVTGIKDRLKPVARIMSFLTGAPATTNGEPKASLLRMGANLGVDLLVGSKLRKAGWLARLLVPPLLRGISSTVLSRVKKVTEK